MWFFIAQYGWRPQHVRKIKWRNVLFDSKGKPYAITADGSQEDFKTEAPIIAWLFPDVKEALTTWMKESPDISSEKPILPWRNAFGYIEVREMTDSLLRNHWKRLQEKWNLPKLLPTEMRHWVATACRKANLSRQASASLTGHDSSSGGSMRDWYDFPQSQETLEEQAQCLPNGPLGIFRRANVEVLDTLPDEAITLMHDFFEGKMGVFDLAGQMEEIRLRQHAGSTQSFEQ